MATSYTLVSYDHREVIADEISKGRSGKVFFFNNNIQLDCVEGQIVSMKEHEGAGWFIEVYPGSLIRMDRIITVFGKPGPAFDEHDSYSNACLDCKGGYELENNDRF